MPIEAEASTRGHSARIFVRDDDAGELTPELMYFCETFAGVGVPVSYQIIPARLTLECADYLLRLHARYPALVEFGQHGLHHKMTLRGRQLKREFGPERSLEDQTADIAEGSRLMRERLGDLGAVTVFTPPQHKYDRNTVLAAAKAGHSVFSGASYPSAHHQLAYKLGRHLKLSSVRHHGISYHGHRRPEADLIEVSISLAMDNGRKIRLTAADLPRAITSAMRLTNCVGLMFHHALYQSQEAKAELTATAEALAAGGLDRLVSLSCLEREDRARRDLAN